MAAALLTILFLSLLFLASLMNVIFTFYPNKTTRLYSWLPSFSPRNPNSSKQQPAGLSREIISSSSADVAYSRKVFSTFDKDGDGFITRQELRDSFKGMRIAISDEELEELIAKSDDNRDGLIDLGEFSKLLEEANMGGEEVVLKEAFDVFDKDQDGLISVEELGMVLTSMGLGKKVEECLEMISKVDMDGDGMVNFEEFKRMMMVSNI